jgi:regulator of sigma E protease
VDLLYFILFVSILIFIHELGHFSAAKMFGVKVLTFSIGFGPKIIRIRGKETEYCLGILPFGGFVKMLEAGKGETILPEDEKRTFEAQSLGKRVLIVLAGPAMNVLFPIALYTSVYADDKTFEPPTVGVVVDGKPADGKLEPGDVIAKIDGDDVESFPDVQSAIKKKAGKNVVFSIMRDGKPIDVTLTPAEEIEMLDPPELEMTERVGRVGISPSFLAPVLGIARPDSPAYRAGLRTFDRVTAINGRKVERFTDLVAMLSQNRGDTVVVTYMRPESSRNKLFDAAVLEPGVATLTPLSKDAVPPPKTDDYIAREADVRARTGIETADLYVAFVPQGASEWRAGLRPGDRITELDGTKVLSWASLEADLVKGAQSPHEVSWLRDGEQVRGAFQMRRESWEDEYGQHYERYVFRTTNDVPRAPDQLVQNTHLITYAVGRGFSETWSAMRFVVFSIVRLLQGRVSFSQVSGPITLYDIAGEAGAKGPTYFSWAMAITSVNLGLINLLPIPVLDGGHLLLFAIEGVRRRPLSLRTREVASLFGMMFLIALMLVAFKNDVTRKWDVIRGQVHEIFS